MGFRLATYNVLDLFDEHPLLPKKIDTLAARIRELDADVVGLQEIGSEVALEALRARASEGGTPYASVVGTADARGIRCAALSRVPILRSTVHTTDALPFPVFVEGDA